MGRDTPIMNGWELRVIRERLKLRRDQLAWRLDIESYRINEYEQGVAVIPPDVEQRVIQTVLARIRRDVAHTQGDNHLINLCRLGRVPVVSV
jgi:DNA-binding transcriptional regulator YiaG